MPRLVSPNVHAPELCSVAGVRILAAKLTQQFTEAAVSFRSPRIGPRHYPLGCCGASVNEVRDRRRCRADVEGATSRMAQRTPRRCLQWLIVLAVNVDNRCGCKLLGRNIFQATRVNPVDSIDVRRVANAKRAHAAVFAEIVLVASGVEQIFG
jgi:hypothetical protein